MLGEVGRPMQACLKIGSASIRKAFGLSEAFEISCANPQPYASRFIALCMRLMKKLGDMSQSRGRE